MKRATAPLHLFRLLTNGLYVIGVAHGDQRDAFTAAWVTQVSFDPLLVALSINPEHFSYPILVASKAFTISILASDQLDLARHFGLQSGRDTDKLAGQSFALTSAGTPYLLNAVAYLDCSVTAEHPAGDHQVVIAKVTGGELLSADARVLRYDETGNLDGSAELYPDRFQVGSTDSSLGGQADRRIGG